MHVDKRGLILVVAFITVVVLYFVANPMSPRILTSTDITEKSDQNQNSSEISQESVDGIHHIPRDMLPPDTDILERFKNLSGPGIKQDDPELIQFLRDNLIDPPRPFVRKLSHPLYKTPQAVEVDKILKGKTSFEGNMISQTDCYVSGIICRGKHGRHRECESCSKLSFTRKCKYLLDPITYRDEEYRTNGFYVECGAFDGERSSNSLWFEHMKNWKGFLIEMDPSFYLQVRGKNRRSHSINACLSPQPYPIMVPWEEKSGGNGQLLTDTDSSKSNTYKHEALCFPFFSLMLALNVMHVDYFSLDVEGQELHVLKTIPFDKIDISVLTVEYLHADKQAILDLMKQQGYVLNKTLDYANEAIWQWSYDYVFVKESLVSTG